MNYKLLLISLFLAVSANSFGQTDSLKRNKRNYIEFYPVILHYFDGTKTNWKYLVRDFRNPDRLLIPFHFGLHYTIAIDEKRSIRLSYLNFLADYYEGKDFYIGEYTDRHQYLFSAAYLHMLYKYKGFSLKGLGDLTFRYGHESQHLYYYGGFEQVDRTVENRDIGLGAGIKLQQKLAWNFSVFTESTYTYYVFRYDKGEKFLNRYDLGPTKHMMTFKLGLGYNF